ncbi:DinB family protein [Streptomyces sp. DT199]|uniref:DinB family protein n=1 Tax=Streptomyces TaxID=1883 RepID=UPI0004C9A0EF|nr:DinB family protein [Streptomyces sp. NRRL S-146]
MTTSSEKTDLLAAFAEQRALLLITVRGLTDAQAGRRTTVSELTLGGIVKHLATGEEMWTRIMSERDGELPDGMLEVAQYRMAEDDTLPALLERYASAARATEEAVAALPDLDVGVPLPKTPWSPPEPESWSARRILLHLIRETAQHAGHADLVRETLDGANTTAQR